MKKWADEIERQERTNEMMMVVYAERSAESKLPDLTYALCPNRVISRFMQLFQPRPPNLGQHGNGPSGLPFILLMPFSPSLFAKQEWISVFRGYKSMGNHWDWIIFSGGSSNGCAAQKAQRRTTETRLIAPAASQNPCKNK